MGWLDMVVGCSRCVGCVRGASVGGSVGCVAVYDGGWKWWKWWMFVVCVCVCMGVVGICVFFSK